MVDVYKRIKELRIAQGMSQGELANKTGYTDRSSIAKIESGKVDLTQSKIIAFASALHTTPGYLIGMEDHLNPAEHSIQPSSEPNVSMDKLNLTPEEIELIKNYRKASKKVKNIILALLTED